MSHSFQKIGEAKEDERIEGNGVDYVLSDKKLYRVEGFFQKA